MFTINKGGDQNPIDVMATLYRLTNIVIMTVSTSWHGVVSMHVCSAVCTARISGAGGWRSGWRGRPPLALGFWALG